MTQKSSSSQPSRKNYLLNVFKNDGCSLDLISETVILEMLLLDCHVKQENSYNIAETLLNRFGSVKGVMQCSLQELTETGLFTELQATELKIFGSFMAKLLTDRYKLPIKADESDNFFGYLKALFFFERNERLAVLPMNGSGAVIGAYFVSEGNRKSVSACFDNILEYIFKGCKQGKFILAHNHPENLSEPSAEDISSTAYIQNRALECGGELTAHYIVGTDGVSKVPMECSYIEYLFNKQNLEK